MQKIRWATGRWWFWVGLVVLIVGGWYVWGYASWWLAGADSRAENRSAYLGWLKMEADSKALEAQYRADNYGGTTPEETLRLFIEALEKKDYALAAKYFVVEKQEGAYVDLQTSNQKGMVDEYMKALGLPYKVSIIKDARKGDIDFYEGRQQAHFEIMTMKPFTKKWKLTEL